LVGRFDLSPLEMPYMCRVALLCLLACTPVLRAGSNLPAATLPVTVLLDFEQPHSSTSLQALAQELERILGPARLKVDLRIKSEMPPASEYGELVLFKMRGHCTMNALPIAALSDERGALAMTYSVDGQLLPFGEVQCDRVRGSVQRALGKGDPERHQAALGIALARVMAHEMYHMIANRSAHTKDGVTKESLSARELSQAVLPLSGKANDALRVSTDSPDAH
jgi:hypothetical protein